MTSPFAATAIELAQIATETALEHFRTATKVEVKSDESPVTAADKQIELEIRAVLAERFPNHAILGEEFGTGDLKSEHVWVVDPIDGTRSFIGGHPLFGFLLAHMQNGIPTLGLIAMPALDEVYLGIANTAATCNGQPIRTANTTRLADAILSINEGEKLLAQEPEVLGRLVRMGHTRRFGYDCYPYALLAAGHIDAVVDFDLKPFDFLPLMGVILAAGGVITDWSGLPLNYDSDGRVVAAATPELHAEILAQLNASGEASKPD